MDVFLFILFAVLQLALAGLGVYVSLKPQPTERHRPFIAAFLLLAVLAIVVGVIQQVQSGHTQASLQGQLTDIQKKIVKPPTAEENAAAVMALQEKTQEQAKAMPPPRPSKPMKPSPPAARAPKTSPQEPPSSPGIAQFSVTQNPEVSSRADAPNLTRVVIQTTTEFPRLRLAVQCDGPIVDGNKEFVGTMMMVREGIVNGHPNIFVLTYESAAPPFGPANPLTLRLWSKNPIVCRQASTF